MHTRWSARGRDQSVLSQRQIFSTPDIMVQSHVSVSIMVVLNSSNVNFFKRNHFYPNNWSFYILAKTKSPDQTAPFKEQSDLGLQCLPTVLHIFWSDKSTSLNFIKDEKAHFRNGCHERIFSLHAIMQICLVYFSLIYSSNSFVCIISAMYHDNFLTHINEKTLIINILFKTV